MNFEHQLILLIYATERNNLPNYFNQQIPIHRHWRENESMKGIDGKTRGQFLTIYDWETFTNYHPPSPPKAGQKGGSDEKNLKTNRRPNKLGF